MKWGKSDGGSKCFTHAKSEWEDGHATCQHRHRHEDVHIELVLLAVGRGEGMAERDEATLVGALRMGGCPLKRRR